MTPDEAADLAARTLAAIPEADPLGRLRHYAADRERVASDLAGLRDHSDSESRCVACAPYDCADAPRYSDGLRRTAALYGVTP